MNEGDKSRSISLEGEGVASEHEEYPQRIRVSHGVFARFPKESEALALKDRRFAALLLSLALVDRDRAKALLLQMMDVYGQPVLSRSETEQKCNIDEAQTLRKVVADGYRDVSKVAGRVCVPGDDSEVPFIVGQQTSFFQEPSLSGADCQINDLTTGQREPGVEPDELR